MKGISRSTEQSRGGEKLTVYRKQLTGGIAGVYFYKSKTMMVDRWQG
jgi:hypothetical protein